MKKLYLLLAALLCLSLAYYGGNDNTRHIYVITTNDIHANINAVPQLASLVKSYRQKGDVLLFDSGDRIVGNPFVDGAEPSGGPMIELCNRLSYDAVTLGNHEFDKLRENLAALISMSKFPIVCANIDTRPGVEFPAVERYLVIERQGVRIGVTGVVDTDGKNGCPVGGAEGFADFVFSPDAATAAAWCDSLSRKSDLVILLSHMGHNNDLLFAGENPSCRWIAGGHTHTVAGMDCGGIHISQNGKNLGFATVADISVNDGRITGIEFLQVDINTLEADPEYVDMVADIKARMPWLNEKVGRITESATQDGVANMMVDALLEKEEFTVCDDKDAKKTHMVSFKPEYSFYHYGGVRLANMLQGDVTLGDVIHTDPFGSQICIGRLTGDEIRRMILDKYNSYTSDNKEDKESHYIYFRSNLPYEVILGDTPAESPDALDVVFDLDADRDYDVVMCNYIADNYIDEDIVAAKIIRTEDKVTDVLLDYIGRKTAEGGLTPDNTVRQSQRRR